MHELATILILPLLPLLPLPLFPAIDGVSHWMAQEQLLYLSAWFVSVLLFRLLLLLFFVCVIRLRYRNEYCERVIETCYQCTPHVRAHAHTLTSTIEQSWRWKNKHRRKERKSASEATKKTLTKKSFRCKKKFRWEMNEHKNIRHLIVHYIYTQSFILLEFQVYLKLRFWNINTHTHVHTQTLILHSVRKHKHIQPNCNSHLLKRGAAQ